jgi:hypothetical protein
VAPNVLPETPSALQIREFLGLSPVCARPTAASEYKLVPFTFVRSKSKAKLRGLVFVTALYHMGLHFTESQPVQVRNEIARILLRSFSTQMPANVSKKRAAASIGSDVPLTSKLDDYWARLRGQSNHAEDCCTVECSYWSVYTLVRHRWAQPIHIVDDDVRVAIEQVHHFHRLFLLNRVCVDHSSYSYFQSSQVQTLYVNADPPPFPYTVEAIQQAAQGGFSATNTRVSKFTMLLHRSLKLQEPQEEHKQNLL